jgi:hypothetical protein
MVFGCANKHEANKYEIDKKKWASLAVFSEISLLKLFSKK